MIKKYFWPGMSICGCRECKPHLHVNLKIYPVLSIYYVNLRNVWREIRDLRDQRSEIWEIRDLRDLIMPRERQNSRYAWFWECEGFCSQTDICNSRVDFAAENSVIQGFFIKSLQTPEFILCYYQILNDMAWPCIYQVLLSVK